MSSVSESRLRELYVKEDLTQKEIADELDVTQSYISRKMSEFDIESNYSFWTEGEVEKLEENYQDKSRDGLLDIFEDHSWNSIKLKAIDVGVAKSAEQHRNSREVKEKLRQMSEDNAVNIDFGNTKVLSYVLGVIDGDGFHDRKSTVGLEVTNSDFADKFESHLEEIGMNPGRGTRRTENNRKQILSVWASAKELIDWVLDLEDFSDRYDWLSQKGEIWKYIEGRYESDGNIHPSGSPRICSYDEEAREFMKDLFSELQVSATLQQNNVWVSKSDRDKFFDNIDPVLRKKGSQID